MAGQGSGGNVIAAICNFFIPGLGHLVQGRILAAILFFVSVGVCYALSWTIILGVVGVIIHIFAIISAARYKGED